MTATILRLAIAVLLVVSVSLQARALDSQSKINLQAALLNFFEQTVEENGRFQLFSSASMAARGTSIPRHCCDGLFRRHGPRIPRRH